MLRSEKNTPRALSWNTMKGKRKSDIIKHKSSPVEKKNSAKHGTDLSLWEPKQI